MPRLRVFVSIAAALSIGLAAGSARSEDVRTTINRGTKNVSLETSAVDASGDLAVEDGTVKVTGADGAVSTSRSVVVWKREGGTGKLHRDIWNAPR